MKQFVYFLLLFCLPQLLTAQVFYSDVAVSAGIDQSYGAGTPGAGASFCDFDNDGWDDLTLGAADGLPIRFFKNVGGNFVEIPAPVDHQETAKQILWVDFDNDGDPDLFVATDEGVNRLYRNNGDLVMEDITGSAGLPLVPQRHFGACWGDYDRDGWLDLYYGERKMPLSTPQNQNRLFRNNADGTFTEVTQSSGAADPGRLPFCSGFLDYNNDNWPDLYTANDKSTVNTLLENNGDGTFTDVSEITQTDLAIDAMNVAFDDYNNDGWLDIYISNTEAGSALLRNNGATAGSEPITFDEVGVASGAGFVDGIGWGANFLDADNDGFRDIYISGMKVGADVLSSAFYQNAGDGSFFAPDAGFVGDTVQSFTNAIGDFNNDGYPDIMVNNHAPFASQLWQNGGGDHQWLKLNLEGVLSNRDGVGARIELFTGDHYQMQYTHCGIGFMAQNSADYLFGLGTATSVDSVRVTWPTGHIDRLQNVAADQVISLVEGSTTGGEIYVDPDVDLTIVSTESPAPDGWEIRLSPNPAPAFLNLQTQAVRSGRYLITDGNGRVLRNGRITMSQQRIDVRDLPAGAYFLILWRENGDRTAVKWIKG